MWFFIYALIIALPCSKRGPMEIYWNYLNISIGIHSLILPNTTRVMLKAAHISIRQQKWRPTNTLKWKSPIQMALSAPNRWNMLSSYIEQGNLPCEKCWPHLIRGEFISHIYCIPLKLNWLFSCTHWHPRVFGYPVVRYNSNATPELCEF